MIFNSSLFLLYFLPAFLIIYFVLDRKFKNWFILFASLFFYAWGAPLFVLILAGSVVIDFFLVRGVYVKEGSAKKLLFWLSVILNIGLLLYFKYMNFFVDQLDTVIGRFGAKPPPWTAIALPLGISFITFQKLSYTFDMSRRTYAPFQKIQDYALYIFMFPQMLSGPIVRAGQIAGQITDRSAEENLDSRLIGFYRFIIGLAKKVLIADALAGAVNPIFRMSSLELSSGLAWIGAIGYTFQIYFDFSGYTDMAIGLARMMGFRLPENFNNPYVSKSITEFWRRWHMTLSSWFRDYIFLPLAFKTSRAMPKERYIGLRADKVIYLIATSVTFLLCGFWHGAAWTFIFWGAYQGFFLILDRLFLLKVFKRIGKIPSLVITFFTIMIGWILFRSASLDYFYFFIRRMFSFRSMPNHLWITPKFWTMLVIAVLCSFPAISKKVENWQVKLYDNPGNRTIVVFTIFAIILFILSEATISSNGFTPFIYFRF
ncbi:MAG: MBOAT family protein [Bacteroidetes bacterium]|nr:MBOAT family protein [Bacteroidota bacterium]